MAVMDAFEPSLLSEGRLVHQPPVPRRVHLRDSDDFTRCKQRRHLRRQSGFIFPPPLFARHEIIEAAATAAQVHAGTSDLYILRRS